MASTLSFVFCQKNLSNHSQAVYDLLQQEHPEVSVEIKDCVDKCGLCTDVPFVIRNNSVVAGRDPRDLYVKIEKGLTYLKDPVFVFDAN